MKISYREFALYRAATKGIVRWENSDEGWLRDTNNAEVQAAESELKKGVAGLQGMSVRQIWEHFGLAFEWNKYRNKHNSNYELPVFRAFYRLLRRRELVVCGRNQGTFREPLYILKENVGIADWPNEPDDEKQAKSLMIEKLTASLGVTDPIHISHLTGFKTADVIPVFNKLTAENKITRLPYKIVRRSYYIHFAKIRLLDAEPAEENCEVRLISPMDTIVRDKNWLETFFNYSFSFEYFKKKGMKWPLSILVGNQFVGYLDCKME